MTVTLLPLGAEFDELFTAFRHTAFRLETLDRYDVGYEEEPLRRFLAGKPKPHDDAKQAWVRTIADALAAGKRMERVHVVTEPLTDYLRFELAWGYPENVEAGEDIRILPVSLGSWPAGVPNHDFWLFDSKSVAVMRYDDGGRFRGAELVEDSEIVMQHCSWRDAAWRDAVPYKQYLAARRSALQAS
jgi:uncharacterized protein DUF6879